MNHLRNMTANFRAFSALTLAFGSIALSAGNSQKQLATILDSSSSSDIKAMQIIALKKEASDLVVENLPSEVDSKINPYTSFFESHWSDSLLTPANRVVFLNFMKHSFAALEYHRSLTGDDSKSDFDILSLIQQNTSSLADASSSQRLFWLSLVPCLDAGTGELLAETMGDGLHRNPKPWIESAIAADALVKSVRLRGAEFCGSANYTDPQASAVNGLGDVILLSMQSKDSLSALANIKNELRSSAIDQLLHKHARKRSDADKSVLKDQLSELRASVQNQLELLQGEK